MNEPRDAGNHKLHPSGLSDLLAVGHGVEVATVISVPWTTSTGPADRIEMNSLMFATMSCERPVTTNEPTDTESRGIHKGCPMVFEQSALLE